MTAVLTERDWCVGFVHAVPTLPEGGAQEAPAPEGRNVWPRRRQRGYRVEAFRHLRERVFACRRTTSPPGNGDYRLATTYLEYHMRSALRHDDRT